MRAAHQRILPQPLDHDLSKKAFNTLVYNFLRVGRTDDAIVVSTWATQLFPASSNTRDSLREAYRKAGQILDARHSHAAPLSLNPTSEGAEKR